MAPSPADRAWELDPGTRLGPYEIVTVIGAGGMGEVYEGRDTRLHRTVAIKILPAEFAADADLRRRFEREARAISQFNHPHICTLYDVGSAVPTSSARRSGVSAESPSSSAGRQRRPDRLHVHAARSAGLRFVQRARRRRRRC